VTRVPAEPPSIDSRIDRRKLLATVPGILVALAGCSTGEGPEGGDANTGDDGDDGSDDGSGNGGSTDDSDDGSTDDSEDDSSTDDGSRNGDSTDNSDDGSTDDSEDDSTDDGDLDLREANVTAVSFEGSGQEYSFDVELYHDDDGEDGYANWWQVETLDGEQLGRRELLHAHGTRRFTRSETIDVPNDVAEVVVRGHDQTHGYGGRAAIVGMGSGDVEFVDQGPEPRDFSDR